MTAITAERKQVGHRWQKGQSGNPGGRAKMPEEVRELMRKAVPGIMKRAIELTRHPKPEIALKAMEFVLDRYVGKPVQAIDDVSERPAIIVAEPMTTEQWLERFGPETEVMGHGD